MILGQCPNCGVRHVQTTPLYAARNPPDGLDTWHLVSCQNPRCSRFILVIIDHTSRVKRVFPAGHHEFDASISIPDEIRNDYREAGWCLDAGCYLASMVMSRRALQRVLKSQGCGERNLVDAIDAAIRQGVLRKAFAPLAQEVREYGNLGAHPDDEQLKNATQESAGQLLGFVRIMVSEFYEVPAEAEKLKSSRDTRKKSTN